MLRTVINSITFTSPKCFYCDDPWKYRLDIEPIDSVTKELMGKLVEIRVCQNCRDTKLTKFEDRIRNSSEKKTTQECADLRREE